MFSIRELTGKKPGTQKTGTEKSRGKKRSSKAGETAGFRQAEPKFAASLNTVQHEIFIEDLHKCIGEIQQQGETLKQFPNKKEFLKYKNLISTFLKQIVRDSMRVQKKQFHRKNQEQVTAEIINEKVYQLGQYLLLEEEETLEVAAAIDEIRGLLFDSFQAAAEEL